MVEVADGAVEEIKFAESVPVEEIEKMLGQRLAPGGEVGVVAGWRVRTHSQLQQL